MSNTFIVLLATNAAKFNIEEYTVTDGERPLTNGYYTIPM